jgi:putative ABC transport system permease protein
MEYAEAVRFSLQSLKSNPLRTFLTALGLIIGNASVILVVTISLVGKDFILDQIRGIGSNLVYANYEMSGSNYAAAEADFIKIADLNAIRDALGSEIVAATGVMQTSSRIVINGRERDVTINGTDDQYARVRNIVLVAGRKFDPSDIQLRERVAMITEKLALRLFPSATAAVGQSVRLFQLKFSIIGVFKEKTSTFGISEITDDTVMIPITVAKYFLPYERVDPLYIQVRYAENVPRVTREVKQILEARHRPGARYSVANLSAILDAAKAYYNLGANLVNTGKSDEAADFFKKAIDADPNYADAHYQYGICLMAKAQVDSSGKITPPEGTADQFQKYLDLKPDGPYAQSSKDMLTQLGSSVNTTYKAPSASKSKTKKKQ